MTERAVFLFSSDTAADDFITMVSAWPAPCTKLAHQPGSSLIFCAKTAGDFVVNGLLGMRVYGVSAELQKPLDIQFSTAMRMCFGEELLVALWFNKKFEAKVKSFNLATSRLDQMDRALQNIEDVSIKHTKAVEKAFPGRENLGTFPMDVYFKVVEIEYTSLCHIIYQEVTAALI